MDFRYEVEKASGSASVITVFGDIDAGTALQLETALDGALRDKSQTRIVFDLHNTAFVSSSGLRLFMIAAKILSKRKGLIYLVGCNDKIVAAVTTSGMHKILNFAAGVAEALVLRQV